jgi:hypothetical protein
MYSALAMAPVRKIAHKLAAIQPFSTRPLVSNKTQLFCPAMDNWAIPARMICLFFKAIAKLVMWRF